jgi:hypothetical protein
VQYLCGADGLAQRLQQARAHKATCALARSGSGMCAGERPGAVTGRPCALRAPG